MAEQVAQYIQNFLDRTKRVKAIIFLNYRSRINKAAPLLEAQRYYCGLNDEDRLAALTTFFEAPKGILFATDYSSYGIDNPRVDTVLLLGVLDSLRDIIQIFSRTGCADQTTFVELATEFDLRISYKNRPTIQEQLTRFILDDSRYRRAVLIEYLNSETRQRYRAKDALYNMCAGTAVDQATRFSGRIPFETLKFRN